jgi:hypothetical protein
VEGWFSAFAQYGPRFYSIKHFIYLSMLVREIIRKSCGVNCEIACATEVTLRPCCRCFLPFNDNYQYVIVFTSNACNIPTYGSQHLKLPAEKRLQAGLRDSTAHAAIIVLLIMVSLKQLLGKRWWISAHGHGMDSPDEQYMQTLQHHQHYCGGVTCSSAT